MAAAKHSAGARDLVKRLAAMYQREREIAAEIRAIYREATKECGVSVMEFEFAIQRNREESGWQSGRRVYFAKLRDRDLVKIGVTSNVEQRLTSLPAHMGCPVDLIGTINGNGVTERVVHYQFRAHREHGEVFAWTPISEKVRGLIARNSGLLPGALQ